MNIPHSATHLAVKAMQDPTVRTAVAGAAKTVLFGAVKVAIMAAPVVAPFAVGYALYRLLK